MILYNISKTNKFSILADKSTDISAEKNLALVVRTCDNYIVDNQFLRLLLVADATIFIKLLHIFFNFHNIQYKNNLIGFAADGVNTMIGKYHSLKSLFINYTSQLFVLTCVSFIGTLFWVCMPKTTWWNWKKCCEIFIISLATVLRQHEFKELQLFSKSSLTNYYN